MMMKAATLMAVFSASASAFAPSQQSTRSVVSLNAERSKALPFMNRPPLVSPLLCRGCVHHYNHEMGYVILLV